MIKRFDGVAIRGVSASVPRAVKEMASPRVTGKTGIQRVRIADTQTTASDLCLKAAERLLADLSLRPEGIDALVFVSPTPDFLSSPTSHILQHRLGLPSSAPCFDLTFGCSGYIYALLQGAVLITSGLANRVLLLVGETTTKLLDPGDRATTSLFGDAGSATVMERSVADSIFISIHSDGSGYRHILCPNSGLRRSDEGRYLRMNGAEVFSFAVREVPPGIEALLKGAGVSLAEMDLFVFHQANKMIIDFIVERLRLDPTRVLWSIRDFGNTGAPSIPLSLIVDERAQMQPKGKVLAYGFGVGLSWGGAIMNLAQTHIARLVEAG